MSDQTPPPRKSDAAPPFHTRYGFSRTASPLGSGVALTIEPYPEICHLGFLRPTILVSAVDLVASLFVREAAGLDVTFTSDLSLRAPRGDVPERIDVRGAILRSGKRLITTAVFLETRGEPYAYGESTFVRLAREAEPGRPAPTLDDLRVPPVIEHNPLSRPLGKEVGIERMGDGGVRLELRDDLLNPEGVLQGALVALIVECTARSFLDFADPGRRDRKKVHTEGPDSQAPRLSAIDLRYLAPARIGPVVGHAARVWDSDPHMLRVELHDVGANNRLTTTALVGLEEA